MKPALESHLPLFIRAFRACLSLDWPSLRSSIMMARLQSTFNLVEVPGEE